MNRSELPSCCRNCKNLDYEFNEFSGTSWWLCTYNVCFPTKKGTCKKQKPYEQMESALKAIRTWAAFDIKNCGDYGFPVAIYFTASSWHNHTDTSSSKSCSTATWDDSECYVFFGTYYNEFQYRVDVSHFWFRDYKGYIREEFPVRPIANGNHAKIAIDLIQPPSSYG